MVHMRAHCHHAELASKRDSTVAHGGGGGATTNSPDATTPPLSVKTPGRGGGGSLGGIGLGGEVGDFGRGGGFPRWGGLRTTHYYHMHTSFGGGGVWGFGGTEVRMR